jgi:phosphopantetheinyl transferase (holo-ACP synthase)
LEENEFTKRVMAKKEIATINQMLERDACQLAARAWQL